MSYEGFTELLCENGHYYSCGQWDEPQNIACKCGAKWIYFHIVDITNGYGQQRLIDENNTQEFYDEYGPKEEIGWDDEWHEDHYGNRFATKNIKYKPLAGWTKI